MHFFLALLSLLLNGAIFSVSGLNWTLIVHRAETEILPDNGILETKTPISDGTQPITFSTEITEGTILFGGTVMSTTKDGKITVEKEIDYDSVDLCVELKDGSWEDIVGQILRQAWLPGGACPVAPGEYTITEPTGPMTLDFNVYLTCGAYSMEMSMNYDLVESKYLIEFPNDPPTC